MTIGGFRPKLIPTLMTIPSLIILVMLGTWQMQRLEWKTTLIEQLTSRQEQPPISLTFPLDPTQIDELKYRITELRGTFLHDKEIHLYTGTIKIKNKRGFYIITPFQLEGSDVVVAVNRGWVPNDLKDADTRPESLVEGVQTIRGMLSPSESPTWFTPDNDYAHNVWIWMDLDAMRTYLNLPVAPLALLQKDSLTDGLYPIPPATHVTLRNDHLQYAITWYSLAIALLVIYILYHRKPS